MVMMLSFISCETEPYEGAALKATNVKGGIDDNGCETGFAVCLPEISTCFLDLNLDDFPGLGLDDVPNFNRWGWTIGPFVPADTDGHEFGIFAGAGKCDESKGELAGTVTFNYGGGPTATVVFTAEPGYVFKETHLYVGETPTPIQVKGKKEVPTVSPGQYPYKHGNLDNVTTDSYTVDVTDEIYLIAHAVVCKEATDVD